MSDLPVGWVETTLGDVCTVVSGSTPKSAEEAYWSGDISWITPDDLSRHTGKSINVGRRSITQAGLESCSARMVPAGTVLYTSRAPIGYVAIAGHPVCTNQGFKSLVPPAGIRSDYLYWYMHYVTAEVRARASGTTFAEISGKAIKAVPLRLAPFAEQERIVAAIEEQFSRLDAGVAILERVRKNLNRMRAAVLQAAVTGKLITPTGDRASLDALLASWISMDTKQKVRRLSVPKPTRAIPSSWEWVPFGDLTVSFDGRRVPVQAADRARRRGPYRYYGAQGVIDYVDEFMFDGEYVLVAEDGANLTSRVKSIASVVSGQFWVNNHAHVVQPRTGISSKYLALAINADPLSELVTGTAQPKLTAAALNGLLVPMPNTVDQERIVEEVDRQFSTIDALASAVVSIHAQSAALRSSILVSAFSGTLASQDPNDEPASTLLDRIAAYRVSSNGYKPTKGRSGLRTKANV
jgi:type I restriction enzyme, S subunit